MEDVDADFAKNVQPGDIIVGGENFGCGSSREHAPIAIKASGVSCVIAKSFARIFYRNSINIGLPILECPEAADSIESGNVVEVDTASGEITDLSAGRTFRSRPFPEFMQSLISAGGLMAYARQRVRAAATSGRDGSAGCCK